MSETIERFESRSGFNKTKLLVIYYYYYNYIKERLSKKINKKVMGMIENAESEYEELNRKKEV